jgi:hypothetical protein
MSAHPSATIRNLPDEREDDNDEWALPTTIEGRDEIKVIGCQSGVLMTLIGILHAQLIMKNDLAALAANKTGITGR